MVRFRKISDSFSETREIKGNLTSDWLCCSNSPGFWVTLRVHYIFSVNVYTRVCVWIVVCLYTYLSLQLCVLLYVFLFTHASQWMRMRERFVVSFLKNISLQSFQVNDFLFETHGGNRVLNFGMNETTQRFPCHSSNFD